MDRWIKMKTCRKCCKIVYYAEGLPRYYPEMVTCCLCDPTKLECKEFKEISKEILEEHLGSLIESRGVIVQKRFDFGLTAFDHYNLEEIREKIDLIEVYLYGEHLLELEKLAKGISNDNH